MHVMSSLVEYRLVREKATAYKIREDCCYEKVVYQGDKSQIVITAAMDHHNELIGILLCCICDPSQKIVRISGSEYDAIVEDVNQRRLN